MGSWRVVPATVARSGVGATRSPLLTNYVCAYLQLGAPDGARPYVRGVVPGYDANT